MNIKLQKHKAFTLVEALVAISILMIAIASPMALAQKGLSTATQTKDQMIAAFLAQDAVEAVKNIRDQIAISQTTGDWLDNTVLEPCVCRVSLGRQCNFDLPFPQFCKLDTTATVWNSSSIQPGGLGTPSLNIENTAIDTSGNKHFLRYTYNTNTNTVSTKFKRYITIIKTSDVISGGNPNEALVKVRVFWDSPQGVQKIDIQDFIYNYSENL